MGSLKYSKITLLFLVPTFIIYFLFFLIPFFQTVIYSLYEWDGFTKPIFVGLKNYSDIIQDSIFVTGVERITIWALLSVIIKVGSALFLASLLRIPVKGIKLFRAVYFLPTIIAAAAVCLMFTLMYDLDIGLINQFLRMIGLGNLAKSWLGNPQTAFYAAIMVQIVQHVGFFFVILLAGFHEIPEQLYESAKLDGANAWHSFTYISLPLLKDHLITSVILAITASFKDFTYIFILTGGGPGTASEVPATYMYRTIFSGMRYGKGTTIAMYIFFYALAISLFLRIIFKTNKTG